MAEEELEECIVRGDVRWLLRIQALDGGEVGRWNRRTTAPSSSGTRGTTGTVGALTWPTRLRRATASKTSGGGNADRRGRAHRFGRVAVASVQHATVGVLVDV